MSCASCHNDGGSDGRVWDLTGMGEGLRNTVSLRGKGGMAHGFLHWSANFDEVQDFEGQIRALAGGTGLMTDAAFNQGTRNQPLGDPEGGPECRPGCARGIRCFPQRLLAEPASQCRRHADRRRCRPAKQSSPQKAARSATAEANFTESGAATLRDVGTIRQPGSGKRLGAPLTGHRSRRLCVKFGGPRRICTTARRRRWKPRCARTTESRSATRDLSKLGRYLQQIDGQEPAPPASSVGLVAAYAFDEGVGVFGADASGNANTGTLTNGPLWTSGKNGGALQFDGVDDRVRVNDAAVLDLSLAATFEAWVYPTVAPSGWRTILQKEADAYIFAASGESTPASGGTFNGVCCIVVSAPAALPVNTWTHLAASYDGAQIRLYVNGVQVNAVAASGSYEQNANPLWIGGNAPYGEHFTGQARRPAHLQPRAHGCGDPDRYEYAGRWNTAAGGWDGRRR